MAKQAITYNEADNIIRSWLGTSAEVEGKPARRAPRSGGGGGKGKISWGKSTRELPRLTPAQILANKPFITKVKQVAANLGIKPEYIMAIMEIESASTFSPEVVNSLGFTGLIQFGKGAASGLGTTREALSKMTAVEQLSYVEKYFKKNGVKPGSPPSDLYTAVFLPAYVGKPDGYIFASKDSDPHSYWSSNPALRDNSRADKAITKSYLGKLVSKRAANYVDM